MAVPLPGYDLFLDILLDMLFKSVSVLMFFGLIYLSIIFAIGTAVLILSHE